MKFTIDRDVFKVLLAHANLAVQANNPTPLLDHLLITVQDGALCVGSTNGIFSVRAVSFDADIIVADDLRVVISAKKITALVNALQDGTLTFEATAQKAVMTSGSVQSIQNLALSDKYPALPDVSVITKWYEVPRVVFVETLEKVSSVVGTNVTAPHLMMVNVTEDKKMQACDGPRVHQQRVTFDIPALTIPERGLAPLFRLMATGGSESVAVARAKNAVVFKVKNTQLVVQTLAANFPDVSTALLKPALSNNIKVVVDRDMLRDCLKRARVNAEGNGAVHLHLSGSTLEVHSKDSGGSVTKDSVEVEWAEDGDYTFSVNHRHLMDALNAYPALGCDIRFPEPLSGMKPAPIRLVDEEEKFEAVISQLKVDL